MKRKCTNNRPNTSNCYYEMIRLANERKEKEDRLKKKAKSMAREMVEAKRSESKTETEAVLRAIAEVSRKLKPEGKKFEDIEKVCLFLADCEAKGLSEDTAITLLYAAGIIDKNQYAAVTAR